MWALVEDFLNSIGYSFPETRFFLIDILENKSGSGCCRSIRIENVKAEQLRAETVKGDFDFIVSRAVNMPDFVSG
jgi:16S rRNA (guanine527-N7)-methyltransferase